MEIWLALVGFAQMTWVKIEDSVPTHHKIRYAGLEALGLWVAGLCYCAKYRTDGRIEKKKLDHVWPWLPDGQLISDPNALLGIARRLVQFELWEDKGTFWRVHDYLEYQESRKEIDLKRSAARERQRKHRQRFLPQSGRKDELPPHLTDHRVTANEQRDERVSHSREREIVPVRDGSDTDRDGSGSRSGSGSEIIRRRHAELCADLGVRVPGGVMLSPGTEHLISQALARYDLGSILLSLERAALLTKAGEDRTWRPENFRLEILLRSDQPDNIGRALNSTLPSGTNGHAKKPPQHFAHDGGKKFPCTCGMDADHDADFKPVKPVAGAE